MEYCSRVWASALNWFLLSDFCWNLDSDLTIKAWFLAIIVKNYYFRWLHRVLGITWKIPGYYLNLLLSILSLEVYLVGYMVFLSRSQDVKIILIQAVSFHVQLRSGVFLPAECFLWLLILSAWSLWLIISVFLWALFNHFFCMFYFLGFVL